jgi:hypothetical protein
MNLQSTLGWCGPFINYQPLTIGGNEPALSIANIILQTILGPPFCWRFNRSTVSFTASQFMTQWLQDYEVAAPDFGFIEKAWIQDPSSLDIKELSVKTSLSASTEKGRPTFICTQGDDGAGNILFRLMNVPNKAFVIFVQYQKRAALMQSLAAPWAPIPDEFSYIFNWGFLALASLIVNDARHPIFNQKFTAHLLGAQDGLDDMQRNIFLGNWLEITKQAQRATQGAQQGTAARQQ